MRIIALLIFGCLVIFLSAACSLLPPIPPEDKTDIQTNLQAPVSKEEIEEEIEVVKSKLADNEEIFVYKNKESVFYLDVDHDDQKEIVFLYYGPSKRIHVGILKKVNYGESYWQLMSDRTLELTKDEVAELHLEFDRMEDKTRKFYLFISKKIDSEPNNKMLFIYHIDSTRLKLNRVEVKLNFIPNTDFFNYVNDIDMFKSQDGKLVVVIDRIPSYTIGDRMSKNTGEKNVFHEKNIFHFESEVMYDVTFTKMKIPENIKIYQTLSKLIEDNAGAQINQFPFTFLELRAQYTLLQVEEYKVNFCSQLENVVNDSGKFFSSETNQLVEKIELSNMLDRMIFSGKCPIQPGRFSVEN